MRKVFISYSSLDLPIAQKIAAACISHGLEVWLDTEQIALGDSWVEAFETGISESHAVLVLVTPSSLASEYVRYSYSSAIHHESDLLIPVFIDGDYLVSRIPPALLTRQGMQLVPDDPRSYERLAEQVVLALDRRSLVSRAPVSVRDPAGLASVRDLVVDAFAAAGRRLHETGTPWFLGPEQVWISADALLTGREISRFGDHLEAGRLAYFVHSGELKPSAQVALDQLRVHGQPVVALSVRMLRAALADGRMKPLLRELELEYGTKDNLFDTRNALIDERFLFGRGRMLNTIGSALSRNEHVLITGLRKAGKTSLLNILRQHMVDQPVCTVDLQRFDRHHEDWPATLFKMIIEAFDRWGAAEQRRWPFESTAPRTTTELEDALGRRFDGLRFDDPRSPGSMRVLVVFDELERVFPRRGERTAARRWIRAAGALRALSQGDQRYFVMVGADLRPTVNRENSLLETDTNPWFSLFQEMPLPLLDHDATGDMIEAITRTMGVTSVEQEFVERVQRLTGGHPFLSRTLAGEAYRGRARRDRLTTGDLEEGIQRLKDSGTVDSFLHKNLWLSLSNEEQNVLRALLGLPHGPVTAEARTSLRLQGLIAGDRVVIGLFRSWLRDHLNPAGA